MELVKKNTNKRIDGIVQKLLALTAILSALFILIIIMIVAVRGLRPFFSEYGDVGKINFFKFVTGTRYYAPEYRIGYVIINTLYIVFLSIIVSAPISILTALFIAKMAPKRIGNFLATIVEVLAAIPSIIYGVFGSGYVVVLVRNFAAKFGIVTAGGLSTLSTVIVLSMMIMPTITMLSVTAIRSVPKDMEHGSLALGASHTQTMFSISLNAARPGIFAGIILGVGRALGEATAVTMVAGNRGDGPTFSLFETTRTLTSTILTGIHETSDPLEYDIRFSIGLILIVVILITNITLNVVKKRLGRHYGQN
ncbi:MAG TPA: phosphate ABC transporter permease subunit PstC [Acholeplasmataceae bacterium]|nr:phosphate ABC transporter permease subunit PstC [Acholeplasmataceae bacterium]